VNVVVTGSRHHPFREWIWENLRRHVGTNDRVGVGDAAGADDHVRAYCHANKIPVTVYRADWREWSKMAGPIRNRQMLDAENPELLIAFPLGTAKGTKDCISAAKDRGIPVWIYEYPGE
jgi:hypothetical protein